MKKKSDRKLEDDLRAEYDFSTMRIVARGPKRRVPGTKVVHLEPDVAKAFPDDQSVNDALRSLLRGGKNHATNQGKRKTG
jgi:hypothetical protein